MIDVARELKKRNAGRIFICATFGLFTSGFEKFDRAYEDGLFHAMLTTNLVYQAPELLEKPYYTGCDMSKYIALLIDTLNHDGSISDLLNPSDRINNFLAKHRSPKKSVSALRVGSGRVSTYKASFDNIQKLTNTI